MDTPRSLLSIIRSERHLVRSLTSLGLTPAQAFNLLTDDDIITAMTETDPMEGLVDSSDKQEGGGVVVWWNDIEKDKRSVGGSMCAVAGRGWLIGIHKGIGTLLGQIPLQR
jgi:hypothetical protein